MSVGVRPFFVSHKRRDVGFSVKRQVPDELADIVEHLDQVGAVRLGQGGEDDWFVLVLVAFHILTSRQHGQKPY
jgi:hypothetical protein